MIWHFFSIFCVKVVAGVKANEIFCAILGKKNNSQNVGYQGVGVEPSKNEKRKDGGGG